MNADQQESECRFWQHAAQHSAQIGRQQAMHLVDEAQGVLADYNAVSTLFRIGEVGSSYTDLLAALRAVVQRARSHCIAGMNKVGLWSGLQAVLEGSMAVLANSTGDRFAIMNHSGVRDRESIINPSGSTSNQQSGCRVRAVLASMQSIAACCHSHADNWETAALEARVPNTLCSIMLQPAGDLRASESAVALLQSIVTAHCRSRALLLKMYRIGAMTGTLAHLHVPEALLLAHDLLRCSRACRYILRCPTRTQWIVQALVHGMADSTQCVRHRKKSAHALSFLLTCDTCKVGDVMALCPDSAFIKAVLQLLQGSDSAIAGLHVLQAILDCKIDAWTGDPMSGRDGLPEVPPATAAAVQQCATVLGESMFTAVSAVLCRSNSCHDHTVGYTILQTLAKHVLLSAAAADGGLAALVKSATVMVRFRSHAHTRALPAAALQIACNRRNCHEVAQFMQPAFRRIALFKGLTFNTLRKDCFVFAPPPGDAAEPDDVCPICLIDMQKQCGDSSSAPLCQPLCGHTMHTACLEEWLRRRNLCCPICRNTGQDIVTLAMPLK